MKRFSQYISEAKRNPPWKTPCEKIFQRFVFGIEKRGDKGRVGSEENTRAEDRIEDAVWEYIDGSLSASKSKIAKHFKQILDCSKEYPEYFEPTAGYIWRGISAPVTPKNLTRIAAAAKQGGERLIIGGNEYIGVPIKYIPSKRNKVESWSVEPKVADNFAKSNSIYLSIGEVFKNRTKERLLADWKKTLKKIDRVDDSSNFSGKDEAENFRYDNDPMELIGGSSNHIPVVYTMPVDEYCIFSEWFANLLSKSQYLGKESEVVRIAPMSKKTDGAGMYILASVVEAIGAWNEQVETMNEDLKKRKIRMRFKPVG